MQLYLLALLAVHRCFTGEFIFQPRQSEFENIYANMKKSDCNEDEKIEIDPVKGDPEMASFYIKCLLPNFTEVFLSSMLPSVR